MKIGHTIKQLIKIQKVKQSYVAKKANICPSYLSKIIHGKSIPSIKTIIKICDSLDTSAPVMFALSMDETDIKPENLAKYRLLKPHFINILIDIIK